MVRGKGDEAGSKQRLEIELPPFLGALGTLASALLPHVPLLHGWLVLAQLSLPNTKDDDPVDEG